MLLPHAREVVASFEKSVTQAAAKSDTMAEYGREGCIELSSHCAQSLDICPKGTAQTSHGW